MLQQIADWVKKKTGMPFGDFFLLIILIILIFSIASALIINKVVK